MITLDNAIPYVHPSAAVHPSSDKETCFSGVHAALSDGVHPRNDFDTLLEMTPIKSADLTASAGSVPEVRHTGDAGDRTQISDNDDELPNLDELLASPKRKRDSCLDAGSLSEQTPGQVHQRAPSVDWAVSSRSVVGSSQDELIILDKDGADGTESKAGCGDPDANSPGKGEVASPRDPESGPECGRGFDSRIPLLLSDPEAADGRDDGNEDNERRLSASRPRSNPFRRSSEPPHDEIGKGSRGQIGRDEPDKLGCDSVRVLGEEEDDDEDDDDENDEDYDGDDEGERGPRSAKRRKLSTSTRGDSAPRYLPKRRLQRSRGSPSPTSSVDESDGGRIATPGNQHERPLSPRSGRRRTRNISSAGSFSDTGEATSIATSIADTECQEWPVQGFLKHQKIGSEVVYTINFSLDYLHHQLPSPVSPVESRRTVTNIKAPAMATGSPSIIRKARMPKPAPQSQGTRSKFTLEEDAQLVDLKGDRNLPWKQIERFFPGRSIGTLQVHYYTKLKTTGKRRRRL